MIRAIVLVVLALLSCMTAAFPAEEIRLGADTRSRDLFPQLYYQVMDNATGVEDIIFEPARQHAFVPVDKPNQALRAFPNVVWFYARLTYIGQKPLTLVLNYPSVNADRIEFYAYDRTSHELNLLNRAGTSFPFSERQIRARTFAVNLPLKAGQEIDLYIKVEDGAIVPAAFTLQLPELFEQDALEHQLIDGIVMGILAILGIYNLLLWWNMRQARYGLFAGFFFSFLLVVSVLNGSGFALIWPNHPELNPALFYIACGACMGFMSLFSYEMTRSSPFPTPAWLMWMNVATSVALLFSPLFMLRDFQLDMLLWVVSWVMLSNLTIAIRFGFSGQPLARSFAVGWLLFFVASSVLVLTEFGYFRNAHLWQILLVLSVVCSMMLIGFSLAREMQQVVNENAQQSADTIKSLRQYADIYHNAVEGMFSTTLDGQLLSANRAFLAILGYNDLQQLEHDVRLDGMGRFYANPEERIQLVRQLQHANNISTELRGVRRDGTPFWAMMSARLTRPKDGDAFIHGSIIDITQQKTAHEQLAYLASHDSLTGLYNRHYFMSQVQHAWQRLQLDQPSAALLYIDIDQFKVINSSCDHEAGDALLKQIAEQLRHALANHGTLARLGGDEFGLLLQGKNAQEAFTLAYSLLDVVKEFRFFWQDSLFNISVSIGVAELTSDDLSAEHVLKKADSACFVAKEKGRNRIHVFDASDEELQKHHSDIHWLHTLRHALDHDLFVLHIQAIQPIQHRDQLAHYEVLLRLKAEDGSLIGPGNFLSSAERYGLMPQIDRWVLKTYFRWLAQHPQHLATLGLCSINLSGASLIDPLFKAYVQALIDEYRIPVRHLCFEITESVAILNLHNTLDFIQHFRGLGCKFALDDFGSGFSSYGYLKNLPVDFVKIDGNFVRDLLSDKYDKAIVQSIHDVASAMGIQTIAEFVENQDILNALRSMGVHYAQGYGIAKPRAMTDDNDER